MMDENATEEDHALRHRFGASLATLRFSAGHVRLSMPASRAQWSERAFGSLDTRPVHRICRNVLVMSLDTHVANTAVRPAAPPTGNAQSSLATVPGTSSWHVDGGIVTLTSTGRW